VKIAITGKGGVGKSTFAGLVTKVLRDSGKQVIAIDADPDMNLASIFGMKDHDNPKPLSEYKELIAHPLNRAAVAAPARKMHLSNN